MHTITLTNNFHNTKVDIRTSANNQADAWFEIQSAVYGCPHPTNAAKAKLRRITNILCGCKYCKCGIVR